MPDRPSNRVSLALLVIVPLIAIAAFVAWSLWGRTDEGPQGPGAGSASVSPKVPTEAPGVSSARERDRPDVRGTRPTKPPLAPTGTPVPPAEEPNRWRLIGKCTTPTYDDGKEPRPIPGVRVTISAADATKTNWLAFPTVVSDANGRFTIDFEPLKKRFPVYRWQLEWDIQAVKDGMLLFAAACHDLPPPPNDDAASYQPRLHVQMEKGAVITVAVRDPAGALARDAELYVDGGDDLSTTTGHFSITRGETGPVRIVAWSNHGISAGATVEVTEFKHYALPDLHLRPRRTIEGVAHYADGSPARFVLLTGDEIVDASDEEEEIDLEGETPDPLPTARDSFEVRTDRNGRFVVAGLSEEAYEIDHAEWQADWGKGHTSPGIEAHPGRGLARFPITCPRLIVQTFVAGKPCPGVSVAVRGWPASKAEEVERRLARRSLTSEQVEDLTREAIAVGSVETQSDNAVFGVPAPPGSLWLLQIRALGLAPVERLVRFPARQSEVTVPLHLSPLTTSSALRLDVRDDAGEPFEAMHVTLRSMAGLAPIHGLDPNIQHATGDRIEGLAPGQYEVSVDVPQSWFDLPGLSYFERLDRVVDLAPGKNSIEARLTGLGVIDISLSFTNSVAAKKFEPNTKLELRTSTGEVIAPATDRQKVLGPRIWVRSIGLFPGRYTLRLHHPTGTLLERTAEVTAKKLTIIKAKAPSEFGSW